MSDNDFDGIGNESTGIRSLREALEKANKLNKKLLERVESLEGRQANNDLDQILRLRGVNPGVAKFYPRDRATTAEAVEEWVEENKDFFGVPADAPGPVASSLSPVEQEGYEIVRKIQAAEAATQADFEKRLREANNQDEVTALMKEFGAQHTF
jgi:hypothetical protein